MIVLLLIKRFRKCETIRRIQILTKIALVDFDGVLNDYSGEYDENELPKIKTGAKEFLEELSQMYDIEIFTVRNKIKTICWLQKNNLTHLIKDVTNVKNPRASIIVDDRAINFDGDFKKVINLSKDYQPYWKIKRDSSLTS